MFNTRLHSITEFVLSHRFLSIFVLFSIVFGSILVVYGSYVLVTRVQTEVFAQNTLELWDEASASAILADPNTKFSVIVAIAGAVAKPGVYELPMNSRVVDVLTLAGGASEDADPIYLSSTLNPAKVIQDEDKIYIPFVQESKLDLTEEGVPTDTQSSNDAEKISINTASIVQLQELSGIGEKRAEDIVGGRPYTDTHELVEKKIISENLYNQIQGEMSL